MAVVDVLCPECGSLEVVRFGKQPNGEQRYRCNNDSCDRKIFLLNYSDKGRIPEVRRQVVDMAMNGSGIRDTARVLGISQSTVLDILKKKSPDLEQVNSGVLEKVDVASTEVVLLKVEDSELDEMWSFVGNKSQQRWLWHAIDRVSGQVLAYVFGPRKDQAFLDLQTLLDPFGIKRFFTDDWGAYSRHIDPEKHFVGKENTWKIERKHLTLRTRIKRLTRKTICFSKSKRMHDTVIGLFINRFEFGRAV